MRKSVRTMFVLVLVTTAWVAAARSTRSEPQSPSIGQSVAGDRQVPLRVELIQPPGKSGGEIAQWIQAWGPVLALFGVVVTAYFTLRRGQMDARYSYASEILKFRLRQIEEFYAPAVTYIEQSRKIYDKLRWTIEHERKDIPLGGFRLLDYIHAFKTDESFGPLVRRILAIGESLTKLISEKSGLIEGGVTPTFVEYLAHFEILNAASEQELTEEQKEGWHKLGYYPRLLNREIREGYNAVLSHIENYAKAGDKIISELMKHKAVADGRYRRNLIENLQFYEEHARDYAAKFDYFDLSRMRKRFLDEIGRVREQREGELAGGPSRILDVGCGTGRDAVEFIKGGFAVVAIDASPAMLRECTKKMRELRQNAQGDAVGKAVAASQSLEMTFQEVPFRSEFDGVWAAASLLHVPSVQMHEIVSLLIRALKPGGILYMSLKYGKGEDQFGARFYTYYDRREIHSVLRRVPTTHELRIWLSDEHGNDLSPLNEWWKWRLEAFNLYDRRLWLNVLVQRTSR